MSYILDALRRADAERGRGSLPGLHTQVAPSALADSQVPRWPQSRVLGSALGVGALLILLVLWQPWRGESPPAEPPRSSAAMTSAREPALAPIPPPASSSALASTSAPVPATARPDTAHPAAERGPALASAPPPVLRKRLVATSQAARGAASASSVTAKAAAASENPAASAGPEAAAHVMAVADLPEDIRRALPMLAFGGSIYSENPASRFVVVNGQLFHEGDTVAPGLVLQQIRLRSAVLMFKGYRYGVSF